MSIFKGYDIRGVYKETITEDIASGIGSAYATLLRKRKPLSNRLFIARDNRSSSPSLQAAVLDSLLQAGFDVVDLGIVSTSLVQFAINRQKVAGACIITASHNPAQYNGLKLYRGSLPLMSFEMAKLEKIYLSKKFYKSQRSGNSLNQQIDSEYADDVKKRVKLHRKLKVVIDSGNGTCGPVAHQLLKSMGCIVVSLFEDMGSAFLNHAADPHNPANMKWLQEEVVRQNANLGIAFDGDGDRAGFVDEKGNIIREDDVCVLFLKHELQKRKGAIIYDLRLSDSIPEQTKLMKGKAIISKAGRIAIRDNLIKNKALFGGEVSGHYFFSDHFGMDDGIYAGAKMAEIVSQMKIPLSEAVKQIPHYPATPELRLHCENEKKAKVVESIKNSLKKKYKKQVLTIDGVLLKLDDSWGLVRVSNTEPAITLRFEGKTKRSLKEIHAIFSKLLKIEGILLPPLKS
ncbi:phosphomannomutase/phosphoglucomutase [Candidatus Micrarchaeota archaeon]|nr:phosphomannomutase/phosphoglucomutase [Candidatus Micrarchaeota archaeon]